MNKCILIGNLTRDPELRTTTSTGVSVCSFTIAISRRNARSANNNGENQRQEADFIPIVTRESWRKTARSISVRAARLPCMVPSRPAATTLRTVPAVT